jgi:hypothetical protein
VADPLTSAFAKLERAKAHSEALRADIHEVGQGNRYRIPVTFEKDADTGGGRLVIGEVPAHPAKWGLMLGDAIHNYRCALDHAWWELAIRQLGRQPTEKEARAIQFPINKPTSAWAPGNYVKWVGKAATKVARDAQPDRGLDAKELHPFEALRRLSNEDKHRFVHPTVNVYHAMEFEIRFGGEEGKVYPDAELGTFIKIEQPAAPGKEVLIFPPDSPVFEPDTEWEARLTGYVAVAGRWDVLQVVDGIRDWITTVLGRFAPLLK